MRTFVYGAALVLALGACLHDGDEQAAAADDITITVEADKSQIKAKESDLNSKREELGKEQDELRKQREELRQRLSAVSSKDKQLRAKLEADERRLEQQERALQARTNGLEGERLKLERQKSELLEAISRMTARKGGLSIEEREELLARREERVARREAALAQRETGVEARDKQLTAQLDQIARLLEELKGAASGLGKTVVVTAPADGGERGPASKASVQKSLRRIQAAMKKRGILDLDLPERGRGLQAQVETGLSENDIESAQEAVDQLAAIVDGVRIDAAFIQHKFNRINSQASGQRMGAEIEKLLAEVTAAFTNGNYTVANAKLNEIYRKLK